MPERLGLHGRGVPSRIRRPPRPKKNARPLPLGISAYIARRPCSICESILPPAGRRLKSTYARARRALHRIVMRTGRRGSAAKNGVGLVISVLRLTTSRGCGDPLSLRCEPWFIAFDP